MDISLAQFTSKTSSAGVVNVMLGYVPDLAIFISGYDQTNPDIYIFANAAKLTEWGDERHIKMLGSTGVLTVVTTSGQVLDAYDGGDVRTTAQTTNSDPKDVNRAGVAATGAGTDTPVITSPGIRVPSQIQTAGAKNLLIALRGDV